MVGLGAFQPMRALYMLTDYQLSQPWPPSPPHQEDASGSGQVSAARRVAHYPGRQGAPVGPTPQAL